MVKTIWNNLKNMTNATKGLILGLTSSVLSLLTAFHVALTWSQEGAITTVVSGLLTLWIALTYTQSEKRIGSPNAPDVTKK